MYDSARHGEGCRGSKLGAYVHLYSIEEIVDAQFLSLTKACPVSSGPPLASRQPRKICLSMNLKSRIKKAWFDPVWSKVISGGILAALTALGTLLYKAGQWLMTINWGATVQPVVESIAWVLNIAIPLWIVLFLLAGVVLSKFIFRRVTQWVSRNSLTRTKAVASVSSSATPNPTSSSRLPTPGKRVVTDGQIDASVLQRPAGTIAAWALVTDEHNMIGGVRFHRYVLSSAGNDGRRLGNPAYPKYPNAWAISRVTPCAKDYAGVWRFFCNAIDKDGSTEISTSAAVSPGWKLFTVGWSKPDGIIRFYIDGNLIGERPFLHWPEHSTGIITLGTWQSDSPNHQFNSTVGPVILFDDIISSADLETLHGDGPTPGA